MPFESPKKKKKQYKTASDYEQKSIYFDMDDEYQAECFELLNLCGHKQAKFLGLLAHDLLKQTGIDIESLDKDTFKSFFKTYELRVKTGFNPYTWNNNSEPVHDIKAEPVKPKSKVKTNEIIDEEDMEDMDNALAAFGVFN